MFGGKMIDVDATSIHYLIDNGAYIRHKDEYGLTALHHAALRGDEIACEQLLLYATEEDPLVHVRSHFVFNTQLSALVNIYVQ